MPQEELLGSVLIGWDDQIEDQMVRRHRKRRWKREEEDANLRWKRYQKYALRLLQLLDRMMPIQSSRHSTNVKIRLKLSPHLLMKLGRPMDQ